MALLPLAALGAPLVGYLAWRVGALTLSGALAAAGVGFCHLAFGGWLAAGALLTFFCTSTLLSRLGKQKKAALGFEKPGKRDAWQVLANGGVAALCALLGWQEALLGALAVATADTWATELGSLWGGKPRRLTNFKQTEPGESGAVSVLGTLAALLGSLLIGAFAGAAWWIVAAAGLLGALLDSVLGATVQAQWWDETQQRWTEQPDGPPTRGVNGLGNDAVNTLATLFGGLVALAGNALLVN